MMKRKAEVAMKSASIRVQLARVLWLLSVIAALFLAVGALLIALDANQRNGLVKFVLDGADLCDLGVFSRENGIKEFHGSNAATKDALFNWGLGAIVWLVAGRIVDRVVRP
jgi:membrane protease YdiL (CAAX protease family)